MTRKAWNHYPQWIFYETLPKAANQENTGPLIPYHFLHKTSASLSSYICSPETAFFISVQFVPESCQGDMSQGLSECCPLLEDKGSALLSCSYLIPGLGEILVSMLSFSTTWVVGKQLTVWAWDVLKNWYVVPGIPNKEIPTSQKFTLSYWASAN